MPTKKLRSFILENFPYELRVEMDLLSRQRNLQNDAQQAKLFELFRKYDIDATKLGMGTNRYGFKYKSFAIKYATNDDGRIDNMKEFKMSPILQPAVIRVHEMSENGLILVTEYIRPFGSYSDMIKYKDQIKDILADLSSRYLIGDVGISEINYANWGIRLGTDQPVCLDFAYVYDVSSSLFHCTEKTCEGKSILVPNEDFTMLICSNCKRKYRFEDIRIRIGKDEHMKEIGDLSEISYRLTETDTTVELDEKRSLYLAIKRKEEERKLKKSARPKLNQDTEPEDIIDDFIFDPNKR
jgi:hypothetical protein